jgi:hypothetical protein
MDFFSVTQRLTACGKVDVIIVERHQKSADLSLSGGTMRTIRDDDSNIVKPKKKIDTKIKTVTVADGRESGARSCFGRNALQ